MKSLVLSLITTVFSVQAFAMQIELSSMDVASVANHINAQAKKVKVMVRNSENIQHEELMGLIDIFINNMHKEMRCHVETSANPMAFSCGFARGRVSFGFVTTGTLHMDNGQVVGVNLDDEIVFVDIVKQ